MSESNTNITSYGWAYKQLGVIFEIDESKMKKAFDNYSEAIGMNAEAANMELFSIPESAAFSILQLYME